MLGYNENCSEYNIHILNADFKNRWIHEWKKAYQKEMGIQQIYY